MNEPAKDLVTHIDVRPDLDGLKAFNKEIDRAVSKVNHLDRAIRKANELRPRSPYAPPGANAGASAAAAGLAAGLGANLVSRTPIAAQVQQAAQEAARAQSQIAQEAARAQRQAMLALPSAPAAGGNGLAGGTGLAVRGGPFDKFDFGGINWGDAKNNQRGGQRNTTGGGKPPRAERRRREKAEKAKREPRGFDGAGMLAGAASAYALAAGLKSVADSMDAIQQQQAQLDRLPQTLNGGKQAYLELNAAASLVRTDGNAFISTYTNMATATEKLKLSQGDLIKASQGLVGSLQLGGGSNQAVSNALYQMGQAFSSDRFGGDEFRSFMEAIGTQAPKVAEAFGTDVKGLREMSEKGKLTAEVMVKAFKKMADSNIEMLNKQGWTWGQVTTVMKNDWDAFLATATAGGEWKKLMGWMANTVIPAVKKAEEAVSDFWRTTTDDSKKNILLGILGALGAGFLALAIPVLAATWPFIAIGAAVWLALELFEDFKSWMDGKGGNIFSSMFGSFDEFEKRFPNIISLLRDLSDVMGELNRFGNFTGEVINGANDFVANSAMKTRRSLGVKDESNILDGLNQVLGWFGVGDKNDAASATSKQPPPLSPKSGNQTNISNSGNIGTLNVEVKTPEEAARAVQSFRDSNFSGAAGDMAEGSGAI